MPTKGRAPRNTAAAANAASRLVASDARQPVGSQSAEPSYEPSERPSPRFSDFTNRLEAIGFSEADFRGVCKTSVDESIA